MSLRKHQAEMQEICIQLKAGAPVKTIIAAVAPGCGKSALPVILARSLIPSHIDKICWIVPRNSLQSQAEDAFVNPVIPTTYRIRISTNEKDPSRGLAGFTTTYQALAQPSAVEIVADFHKYRYALILDEMHMLSLNAAALETITVLKEMAHVTVLMSGTLERGKRDKIAFMEYSPAVEIDGNNKVKKRAKLILQDTENTRHINYTRADGLAEKALIPMLFTLLDAKVKWKDALGVTQEEQSMRALKIKRAKKALFTALSTAYATELLDACIADWYATRQHNPRAKLLVVASNQKFARTFSSYMTKAGVENGLAIVSEGGQALRTIKRFRRDTADSLPALCTVGMAYIGMDVRAVTHLACLTRIRSKPWIEQMLARATRFDPLAGPWETQNAHIYVPDDPMMRELAELIEAEQRNIVKRDRTTPPKPKVPDLPGTISRDLFGDIIPVSGAASGRNVAAVGKVGSFQPREQTPSEQEKTVRESIESIVRRYAASARVPVRDVNTKLIKKFGKSRTVMNMDELKNALQWVQVHLI